MAIKATNIVSFGLLLIVTVMVGSFLPRSVQRFETRPEDLTHVSLWVGLALCLALTSLWNALVPPERGRRPHFQLLPNVAALLAYGFAATQVYVSVLLLAIGIAALGPVTWLAGTFARRTKAS